MILSCYCRELAWRLSKALAISEWSWGWELWVYTGGVFFCCLCIPFSLLSVHDKWVKVMNVFAWACMLNVWEPWVSMLCVRMRIAWFFVSLHKCCLCMYVSSRECHVEWFVCMRIILMGAYLWMVNMWLVVSYFLWLPLFCILYFIFVSFFRTPTYLLFANVFRSLKSTEK